MDQMRTGKFIAQMRKEKGMTQTQLADKLYISNKTISKWETGKGMPEVSLMLPLCEALEINVNELLTGEKIPDEKYKEKAEETIMNLMRDKKGRKKLVVLILLIVVLMLLPAAIVTMLGLHKDFSTTQKIIANVISVVAMLIGCIAIIYVDRSIGYYECSECGEKFIPSLGKYAFAFKHSPTGRKLKCPKCGTKCWCHHNLY